MSASCWASRGKNNNKKGFRNKFAGWQRRIWYWLKLRDFDLVATSNFRDNAAIDNFFALFIYPLPIVMLLMEAFLTCSVARHRHRLIDSQRNHWGKTLQGKSNCLTWLGNSLFINFIEFVLLLVWYIFFFWFPTTTPSSTGVPVPWRPNPPRTECYAI